MEDRKQRESAFHNLLRDKKLESSIDFESLTANKKYYSITRKSLQFVEKWLSQKCMGKKVLDYCCGNGGMSRSIANLGAAQVVGIDISDVSIENAKKYGSNEELNNKPQFLVMDAENMKFDNNTFDIVYEAGVLHHLNLERAYPEIARVLKPDGYCICIEALGHNKIIQFYRKKTPDLRTEWEAEHILKKRDILMANNYFNKVEIIGLFHLATLAAVPFRNNPFIFNSLLKLMEFLDSLILMLPLIKWQAWQAVFVLSKPIKDLNTVEQNNVKAII